MNGIVPQSVLAMVLLLLSLPVRSEAEDLKTLKFLGRISTAHALYTGTALLKIAIISPDGKETYWSNDGTSTTGNEPMRFISLDVVQGVYLVELGDTRIANMVQLPDIVFTKNRALRFRVWFSDGDGVFHVLLPDQIVSSGHRTVAAGLQLPPGSGSHVNTKGDLSTTSLRAQTQSKRDLHFHRNGRVIAGRASSGTPSHADWDGNRPGSGGAANRPSLPYGAGSSSSYGPRFGHSDGGGYSSSYRGGSGFLYGGRSSSSYGASSGSSYGGGSSSSYGAGSSSSYGGGSGSSYGGGSGSSYGGGSSSSYGGGSGSSYGGGSGSSYGGGSGSSYGGRSGSSNGGGSSSCCADITGDSTSSAVTSNGIPSSTASVRVPEAAAEHILPSPSDAPAVIDKTQVTAQADGSTAASASPPQGPIIVDSASPSDPVISLSPQLELNVQEPVEKGKTFQVRVYGDSTPLRPEEFDIAAPLTISSADAAQTEFRTVVYLLVSEELMIIGKDHRELTIRRNESETDKVVFPVQAQRESGSGKITALFYYNGYPCGMIRRTVNLGSNYVPGSATASADEISAIATHICPPMAFSPNAPDLTITVVKTDDKTVDHPMRYQYFTQAPGRTEPYGEVYPWGNLPEDPLKFLSPLYARLPKNLRPDQARADLIHLGRELFNKAPVGIPQVLREVMARAKASNKIPHILVISDEPHIPWELMVPPGSDNRHKDLPLGVLTAIGRWTLDQPVVRFPAHSITVKRALFWAPNYSTPLKHSDEEQSFLELELNASAIDPATWPCLKEALETTDATLLHFICHGSSGDQPGLQSIEAEDEKMPQPDSGYYDNQITTGELAENDAVEHFCEKRPLIFLNACEVGQTIETLAWTDGFGPTFIGLNAGGIVAPLWSVRQEAAAEIAELFYTSVQEQSGASVGEIMRQLRERAYKGEFVPNLTTFAAYCFYGDPRAHINLRTDLPAP